MLRVCYKMPKFSVPQAIEAIAGIGVCGTASAQAQIRIVGSSTIFPFSTAVAEQFGKTNGFKTPVVESTGSGSGLKLFRAGVGIQHRDRGNASRREAKKSPWQIVGCYGAFKLFKRRITHTTRLFHWVVQIHFWTYDVEPVAGQDALGNEDNVCVGLLLYQTIGLGTGLRDVLTALLIRTSQNRQRAPPRCFARSV